MSPYVSRFHQSQILVLFCACLRAFVVLVNALQRHGHLWAGKRKSFIEPQNKCLLNPVRAQLELHFWACSLCGLSVVSRTVSEPKGESIANSIFQGSGPLSFPVSCRRAAYQAKQPSSSTFARRVLSRRTEMRKFSSTTTRQSHIAASNETGDILCWDEQLEHHDMTTMWIHCKVIQRRVWRNQASERGPEMLN